MLQVRLHLGALETVAALSLSLIVALIVAALSELAGALGLVLGDALLLGLLVGSSLSLGFGLGLLSLLGLLAFDIGIIRGVP